MPEGFYLQVRSGKQKGLLAGPFDTPEEADAVLPQAKRVADQLDPMAGFYDWWTIFVCTTRAGQELPTGRLNARLGLPVGGDSKVGLLVMGADRRAGGGSVDG